jgi:hypothetical protein
MHERFASNLKELGVKRYLTLIFSVISLIFFILLVFLRIDFPFFQLMSYQDVLDLIFPLIMLPIYWWMFRAASNLALTTSGEIAFIVLAGLWAEGHGMHLPSNSINNLIGALSHQGAIDVTGTDIYQLTYFYDEHLSHIIWHLGAVGLAALILYREWHQPAGVPTLWWSSILAGIIYGFTLFSIFLEGGTVIIGLPFTLIVVLLALLAGRRKLAIQPMLAFFFIACLFAFFLFTGWGIYWGGFPQFSEVGLI